MKVIGLLGGMSWESSLEYYRIVNLAVNKRLRGHHSARCVLYSVDFAEIEQAQAEGDWASLERTMIDAARRLHAAGAELLVLCTNTMHRAAPAIEAAVPLPLLHIADPTGAALRRAGLRTVGLLGTRYTMEGDFYRARLTDGHGLRVLVPEAEDRERTHAIIYDELCHGVVREESRAELVAVLARLRERGAQGAILGCTELGLLLRARDASLPLYDTTRLHAEAAVAAAFESYVGRFSDA